MGRSSNISKTQKKLPTRLETILFYLLLFTVPTNLSLNLFKNTASVSGILIDYLIPKLYLSDIIAVLLLLAWFTRLNWRGLTAKIASAKPLDSPLFVPAFALTATLILSASAAPHPLSAHWYLLKVLEMILLTTWVANFGHLDLTKPLSATLIFQSIVALIQWVQKKSLLGYLFLGETTLRSSAQIAKTGITGELRPLPYGTTPHPNVLAGTIIVFILIILSRQITPLLSFLHLLTLQASPLKAASKYLKTALAFSLTLAIITLLLTQSVGAVFALAVCLALLYGNNLPAKFRSLPALALLVLALAAIPFISKESISRRTQLAQISLGIIAHQPILGAGPNNFTAVMGRYGDVPGTTRFIQPVHNIYLLVASEIGLVASALIILLLYQLKSRLSRISLKQAAPLIALLLIGLLDHYPISLQTGQLLLALTTGLALNQSLPFTHHSHGS